MITYCFLGLLQESPEEQHTFYHACTEDDVELKQSYHKQYYPRTLAVLKDHVAGKIDELNELGVLSVMNFVKRHPRLPLLENHNQFVFEIFDAVHECLKTS